MSKHVLHPEHGMTIPGVIAEEVEDGEPDAQRDWYYIVLCECCERSPGMFEMGWPTRITSM